jgi:thioredoxin-dependent peroxiredoxin
MYILIPVVTTYERHFFGISSNGGTMSTDVNTRAPVFSLKNSEEKTVSPSDFAGEWVILYFYPKDNTSGCTKEAIDFSEKLSRFTDRKAVIVGISPDSPKSHASFISRHALKVELLSDPSHETLEAYGVWRKKKMYGREYFGVVRTTFLIDPKGIIREKWEKVKVSGHADAVLTSLCGLQ